MRRMSIKFRSKWREVNVIEEFDDLEDMCEKIKDSCLSELSVDKELRMESIYFYDDVNPTR